MSKRKADDAIEAANKRGREAGLAAVKSAKQRGRTILNHGAGTMPVDAPAPTVACYSLLTDEASTRTILC